MRGFGVIFVIIAIGFLLGRTGTLGPPEAQVVLSRLVFFVATPALLFDVLATSDLSVIFSPTLYVAAATAFAIAALYLLIAKLWLRRPLPELTIGALASSYVNSANLGIPIAVFVLGDASFVAPLLLFQIVLFSPDRADRPGPVDDAGRRVPPGDRDRAVQEPDRAGRRRGLIVAVTGG